MSDSERAELSYLLTARAVREQAERMLDLALNGELEHFAVELDALPALAAEVAELAGASYRDPREIPYHGRYRHFCAGGSDRLERLDHLLEGQSERDKLVARADLVIVSVLLDAGAGSRWSYQDARGGPALGRSEGLGLASYDWFEAGGLSARPADAPLRVDASRLLAVGEAGLERAFQVSERNPLVATAGRVLLLRRLGETLEQQPELFGVPPRPGNLALQLLERAVQGKLRASVVLETLLAGLSPIWPGREWLCGVNLGDVWTHSRLGRIPFHKLSQWLAYSLCEPLEQAGVTLVELDGLTGLAEYRNGGLFVDGGVLRPKHPGVLRDLHPVGSDVVIEWRALTLALLDRIALELRRIWNVSAAELPLCKVLEAGTWRAGRKLAADRRADGSPPIRVDSDGTVF